MGLGPNGPWASLSSGFKDHGTHQVVLSSSMYLEREIFVLFWSNLLDFYLNPSHSV